jgi:hypothetical protein
MLSHGEPADTPRKQRMHAPASLPRTKVPHAMMNAQVVISVILRARICARSNE